MDDDSKDSLERMRNYYFGRMPVTKMRGEMTEILRFAARHGLIMGFTLALNRNEMWGIVLGFDDYTGRITLQGGGNNESAWVRSFLIRKVLMFTMSKGLYQEWKKSSSHR